MSGYSDEDIRRAADIREWLVKQITDKQEEVERLRTALSLIDGLLKQGSFRAAASLSAFAAGSPATAQVQQTRSVPRQQAEIPLKSADDRDIRPLKRAKDDFVLGNVEVLPVSVAIVPSQEITLNVNTPPFR